MGIKPINRMSKAEIEAELKRIKSQNIVVSTESQNGQPPAVDIAKVNDLRRKRQERIAELEEALARRKD